MSKDPTLPSHWRTNPVGQVRRYRAATQAINRHNRRVLQWLIERIGQIPTDRIEVNALHHNAARYEYLLSTGELDAIINELRRRLGEMPSEALVSRAVQAYEAGTGDAVTNLQGITAGQAQTYTTTVAEVLASDPWQRRVALMRSRIFELMEGFEGELGSDLARTLSQAVQDGENPMRLVRKLRERYGVSRSRAERIARTEITQAYRRARLDEAQDAQTRLGIQTKMLHLSALSETSRSDHMARHGNLYTPQEVREWYAEGANAINCKCSQVEVLVDEDGKPLSDGLVNRVKSQ